MWKRAVILILAGVLVAAMSVPAAAHGLVPLVPPSRLGGPQDIRLQSIKTDVNVADGVAQVEMEQRFVNGSSAPAEGTFIFPLPQGAAVSSFQMFVDGQPYTAEVLDADKAQAIYESIVRRNRDPALLRYVGQGLLQARVFPIPPGGERRIRVAYAQVLPRDGGLAELSLPFGDEVIPQASITVNLKDLGAGAVYSPTHTVATTRRPDGSAVVSFEGAQARGNFKLFFGQESTKLGVNLLSYKSGLDDGYFMLLVNPATTAQTEVVAKDVILVIDLSGSMEGEKFEQAKGAAIQVLGALGKDDHFAVIGFHSDTVTYADELRGAGDVAEAIAYVQALRLGGATNIDAAMAKAQQIASKKVGRPQMIMLITDGQPTAGLIDPDKINANVRAAATGDQRIFTFGVGYDVNTVLLDGLAQENRGRSDYVKPGENLEAAVSAFWRKVGQPVLTDVTLTWDGVKGEEVYPRQVPDLFLGSQMVLLGRYRKGGATAVTVSGKVNGEVRTYSFKGLQLTGTDTSRDYIPRLWANRKVGYLLSEIRRSGPNKELIDEVVALSGRFGIVTPYTSFFVNEPGATMPVPAGSRATGSPGAVHTSAEKTAANGVAQRMAAAPASGQYAVESAKKIEQIRGADTLSQAQAEGDGGAQIRSAGDKTFVQREGVWVDTSYAGGDLVYLKLGSDRYLQLARRRPNLASYLAVGAPLVLVDGTTAYGVDIPGKEESQIDMATAISSQHDVGKPLQVVPFWIGGGLAAGGAGALVLWRRRKRAA